MVVVGVEDQCELVAVDGRVAPGEARAHTRGAQVVVHPRSHVERLGVVGEADLGPLRRRLALVRL